LAPVTNLSALERRVVDTLDESALVDDLVALVQVPSVTGTDAESDLQDRCATALERAGMTVDQGKLDLDQLRADPEFPGTEAPRIEGYGVVGSTEGEGQPALILQGHVDVVPTGDVEQWEGTAPFGAAVSGRVLRGRGACDMKAGLAANLAVVRTLAQAGIQLERPLAVHCVVSEEDGGLGAFATLRRGHTGDAAVITEPTSGRLVTAAAGALTFRIQVTGLASHGSTRTEGVSAFEAFLPIHHALRRLETERNQDRDPLFAGNELPYPLSIGMVSTGDWPSSVPDKLTADGRLGVRLGEHPSEARAALEHAVAEVCSRDPWLRDHPATVTWPGGQFASGRLPAGHWLIDEVAGCIEDTTGEAVPAPSAAPYGSDLRLYTQMAGIPTLHYGPGDVRLAHGPREQVDLDETLDVARTLLVLALRRCGVRA
jgi:acetylornithine deacetylase